MEAMPEFKRCAMGDIIKIEYGRLNNLTYDEIEANKAQYRQGLIEIGNWGRKQSPDYWRTSILHTFGLLHHFEVF